VENLENGISIRHIDGLRVFAWIQILDTEKVSASGKSNTEYSSHWEEGNNRGSLQIIDDQGRKHILSGGNGGGITIFTALNQTIKPVKSSKPIAKMTKKEKDAYIAELEANQK
tara:strand:- start:1021 stop:1359 length:339 start_codon:yes stop_codon:yes gene_type:complete